MLLASPAAPVTSLIKHYPNQIQILQDGVHSLACFSS